MMVTKAGELSVEHEAGLETAAADETSLVYLGQWQRLISTTNWEKGSIIQQWREALIASGANWQQYSDEAWSRRVGNVSGQHVGRLRRVFERFGATRETYAGLYWSHFQAAVEWPDAELWLEGAVQNGWSISEMRFERWQAFGGAAEEEPREQDVVASELDEDFTAPDADEADVRLPEASRSTGSEVDFGDEGESPEAMTEGVPFDPDGEYEPAPEPEAIRPFERLAELPADIAEAFESFKLAILHHKLAEWQDIARDDLLGVLESLKQLALAPAS